MENMKVATRIGRPICPPRRWMAKKTEVKFLKSGGRLSVIGAEVSCSLSCLVAPRQAQWTGYYKVAD